MTFSIVALDAERGEMGIAVATCWPAVGSVVPWLEPGVGAVATQAFCNVELGPGGLALLRAGLPAEAALERLLEGDPGRDARQLGLVDLNGRAAGFTGGGCVREAGHVVAEAVSVQANMVDRTSVWAAMLGAYYGASGDLAERLLAALQAGEAEGGDIRGRRSAALVTAPISAGAQPWARRFDVRVDSSEAPLEDLATALTSVRAYGLVSAAIDAADAGEPELALERISSARELAPDDPQVAFWHVAILVANGRAQEAQPVLRAALRGEPRLLEYGRRFAGSGRGSVLADILRDLG